MTKGNTERERDGEQARVKKRSMQLSQKRSLVSLRSRSPKTCWRWESVAALRICRGRPSTEGIVGHLWTGKNSSGGEPKIMGRHIMGNEEKQIRGSQGHGGL